MEPTTEAFETIDSGDKWRTLTAIDLRAKNKIQRQQKAEDDPLIGGVLWTARGLVFTAAKVRVSSRRSMPGRANGFGLPPGRRYGGFRTGGLVASRVPLKKLPLALIATASSTESDLSYGSDAEARL